MLKNIVKLSLRNFWKYKAYSVINLLGLATGIACFVLILLWVQDELSFDRFHANGDRIVRVVQLDTEEPGQGISRVGAPWGPALAAGFPEIESFVRFRFAGRSLFSAGDQQAFESEGLYADSTLFQVFTYPILRGDSRKPLDNPDGIVLTEKLAKKYFGDSDPIGQLLTLDANDTRIVTAIMQDVPENAHMHFDYLLPFSSYQNWDTTEWRVSNFHLYLLLRQLTPLESITDKVHQFIVDRIGEDRMRNTQVSLQPVTAIHLDSHLQREFEANGDRTNVTLFSLVALFILAIACINFVNLTTARSAKRAKEIGIRKVVGSQRSELVRQFIGESVFVSLCAVVLAGGLVELALPHFREMCGKTLPVSPWRDPGLLLIQLGTGLVVGLLSGAYPALLLSRFRPVAILKGGNPLSAANSAGNTNWLRKVLVVLQFAISIALIVGTLVVYRQLGFVTSTKLGYQPEQVLVLRLSDSEVRHEVSAFRTELLRSPAITAASVTSNLLGGGDWGMTYPYTDENGEQRFQARTLIVDEHFVETMDMQIVQGRDFSTEFATDAGSAFLINETAAKSLGWDNPVGRPFNRPSGEKDESGEWTYVPGTIVGVVKDFHFRSLHEQIRPVVMFSKADWYTYLSLRVSSASLPQTMSFIADTWQRFEPKRPLDTFFLQERFDRMYRAEKRFGETFTGFAVLAIVIAGLGLFGLASFVTEQRTREIGIRKVLGATAGGIIVKLSGDFTKWVLLANLLAWPTAYFVMNNWLQGFAYRVELGPGVFVLAGLLAFTIALVTVCFQAVKASLANPVHSLRYE